MRVKSNDLKRKQRKQVKNGGNKSVVSIETCQDDEDVVDDTEEGNNYFEDPEPFDESASFFSMKLSRPLLKSIEALRFIHPTPIQVDLHKIHAYFNLNQFESSDHFRIDLQTSGGHYSNCSSRTRHLWMCCYRYRKNCCLHAACSREAFV